MTCLVSRMFILVKQSFELPCSFLAKRKNPKNQYKHGDLVGEHHGRARDIIALYISIVRREATGVLQRKRTVEIIPKWTKYEEVNLKFLFSLTIDHMTFPCNHESFSRDSNNDVRSFF